MGKYLLRRLVISVPVLLGITLVVYVIVNFAPGDPVDAMINPEMAASMGPGYIEMKREELGLHEPVLVRYFLWLKELSQGNLGFSFMDRQSIGGKIGERLWPTLRLMLTAQLIAIIIAIPVGVLSAIKQYSLLDYGATILGFAAMGWRSWNENPRFPVRSSRSQIPYRTRIGSFSPSASRCCSRKSGPSAATCSGLTSASTGSPGAKLMIT